MSWLTRVFCRHRLWRAADPMAEHYSDHYVITWKKMECLGCGKIRDNNMLKPGEEVVVDW